MAQNWGESQAQNFLLIRPAYAVFEKVLVLLYSACFKVVAL